MNDNNTNENMNTKGKVRYRNKSNSIQQFKMNTIDLQSYGKI